MAGAGAPAWVLGDADTVRAFRLAGFRGRAVETPDEARDALEALRGEGAALVVVTERVYRALGGTSALASGTVRPVVAVVPSAVEPSAAPSPAQQISTVVRRALGMPAERRP
jgi:vacuolar-type H+-ATPase subunit F/Vma7